MSTSDDDADLIERLRRLSIDEIYRLAGDNPEQVAQCLVLDLSNVSFAEDPSPWRRWAPAIRRDAALYAAAKRLVSALPRTSARAASLIEGLADMITMLHELPQHDFDTFLEDTTTAAAYGRRRTVTLAATAFTEGRQAVADGDCERAVTLLERALAGYSSIGERTWMGHCHTELGIVWLRASNCARSARHFCEALAIFEALADASNVDLLRSNLAYCLYESGQPEVACEAALQAIGRLSATAQSLETLDRLANLVISIIVGGEGATGTKITRLCDLAATLVDHSAEAAPRPLLRIAAALGTLGAHAAGYEIGQHALRRSHGMRELQQDAMTTLMFLGRAIKSADEVRCDLNALLAVTPEVIDTGELILSLTAEVAAKRASLDDAFTRLNLEHARARLDAASLATIETSVRGVIPQLESLRAHDAVEVTTIQARLLHHAATLLRAQRLEWVLTYDLARLADLRGDFIGAADYFEHAATMALDDGNDEAFVSMRINAAMAAARGNDLDRGEATFRGLLDDPRVNTLYRRADVLYHLASLMRRRQRADEAIDFALMGVRALRAIEHPPDEWSPPPLDQLLGLAYKDKGEYASAITHLKQALAGARTDSERAIAGGNLASVHLELGDLATAQQLYDQAYAIVRRFAYAPEFSFIYAGRAVVYDRLDEGATAREMASVVLEHGDESSEGYTEAVLVAFNRAASGDESEAMARRIEGLLSRPQRHGFVLAATLLRACRDDPQRAGRLIEALRRDTPAVGVPGVTAALHLAILEMDVPGRTATAVTRLRQALDAADTLASSNTHTDVRRALYAEVWPAVRTLIRGGAVDSGEALDIVLRSKARGTFDASRPLITDSRQLTAAINNLPADVVVVETADLDDRLRLFIVDRTGLRAAHDVAGIPRPGTLATRLGNWSTRDAWNSSAWRTFTTEFGAAVEPYLEPERIVYLITSNGYGLLPLHTAVVRGRFLAELHAVVYGPSVAVLKNVGDAQREWAHVIAVGRDFEGEAQWVADHLGGHCVRGLAADPIGIAQTLAFADVAHFSCHGIYAARGRESGLKLASGGWLTTELLQQYTTNADVVMLAACETAVSFSTGADVVGLDVTFLNIGAVSVLGTLWRVETASTEIFVQAFYRYLIGAQHGRVKQMSKGEAWRRAISDVRADPQFVHPFYWAPFKLSGGWL